MQLPDCLPGRFIIVVAGQRLRENLIHFFRTRDTSLPLGSQVLVNALIVHVKYWEELVRFADYTGKWGETVAISDNGPSALITSGLLVTRPRSAIGSKQEFQFAAAGLLES